MKLTVGVALLGCGTIGASVAEALQHARDAIERRTGVGYELRGVAIRDPHKQRPWRSSGGSSRTIRARSSRIRAWGS